MSEPALICNDIRIQFPEFMLDLDFSIHEGELVSIIGPSGCGKSTTLQIITGLLACDHGSISLNGKDIKNSCLGPPDWYGISGLCPVPAHECRKQYIIQP